MHINGFTPALLSFVTLTFAAAPIQPIKINPTVKNFNSIPSISIGKTFFIGTVQDTSLQRDESGTVGATRVRRRKTAPIYCSPLPALAVKRSLESLLVTKGLNAEETSAADFTLQVLLFDFSLVETSKRVSQTMEATVAMQITVIANQDSSTAKQFTIRTQNSKSTMDTSKHAESVLRGALESALKEIIKNLPN